MIVRFFPGRLTDMYGGIRVVRSFRRERSEWKEFNTGQDTMIRKQQYTAVLGRLLNTGWNTFGPAIGVVIVWYGGLRVLDTRPAYHISIGTLMLYQTMLLQLISPISKMIDSFQNLQQNLGRWIALLMCSSNHWTCLMRPGLSR